MPKTADQKIALMHQRYGVFPGAKCKSCDHLIAHVNGDCSRTWYKCAMYGTSSGPGTDWWAGNPACGAIAITEQEAKEKHLYGEVYRINKGLQSKVREEIPGQLAIEI